MAHPVIPEAPNTRACMPLVEAMLELICEIWFEVLESKQA